MVPKFHAWMLVFGLVLLIGRPVPVASQEHGFRVCERPCPMQRVLVPLRGPGEFEATARWTGSSERITLALHGPDFRVVGARTGSSPLELRVELTPEDLEAQERWWLSVETIGGGTAEGSLAWEVSGTAQPAARRLEAGRARVRERLDRNEVERNRRIRPEAAVAATAAKAKDPAPPTPPSFGVPDEDNPIVRREILEDGRPMLTYTDGTQRILDKDGMTVITHHPDGSVTKPMYSQVPMGDPPPDPAELAGTGMGHWLDRLAANTQGAVETVLDAQELESFLQTEKGKSLYERIDWRLDFLRFYLADGSSG